MAPAEPMLSPSAWIYFYSLSRYSAKKRKWKFPFFSMVHQPSAVSIQAVRCRFPIMKAKDQFQCNIYGTTNCWNRRSRSIVLHSYSVFGKFLSSHLCPVSADSVFSGSPLLLKELSRLPFLMASRPLTSTCFAIHCSRICLTIKAIQFRVLTVVK
jgi:hypothetical protein